MGDGLRLLFIGEGLVLAGAIESARARGHHVAGVFCTSAPEAAVIARSGVAVSGPAGKASAFVASIDCDVIFSIANGRILDAETLARPRLAAVNYHNAPLPAYAGRWATAWAILNGEAEHGITWHLMAPGIDTGPILVQRRFALAPEETTGSLNMRCSEAALASFPDVLRKLESGDITGEPQDFSKRSYFGRSDTVPHGGEIDWHWPAAKILRLVRACDWGASANAFGEARISIPGGGTHVVRTAMPARGSGRPGAILAVDGANLSIACSDGAVRLHLDNAAELQSMAPSLVADGKAPASRAADLVGPARWEDLRPVPGAIMALAEIDPDRPAILGDGVLVTRGALSARAHGIATTLLARGLRRGDGVGLLLPMGSDFIAAALGAMLAGGAYVPLNPSSPPARLAFEIAEAGITHVIGEPVDGVSPSEMPGLVLMAAGDVDGDEPALLPVISSGHCAYRIFTSGSTGRPKAVEISHGALANLVAHYHEALPMGAVDRMTALAHPTFDASVGDIWPILAAGGSVLIPPRDILLDPAGLIGWLRDVAATCAFVPTTIAERLFGLAWPECLDLRVLLTGGSALHRRPPAGLPFRVINGYGPTENTVDSLWGEVGPTGGRPNIGKPIRGVTARIIDEGGRPVRSGETGELVLGGAQLALGYRGRPHLTAERFVISAGERYYRTGDLARMDLNGDYEFHGRLDDQVQVNGIRIEPGEIESLLKADPRVADAMCLPLWMGEQVTGLIAHAAPRSGIEASAELAADLRLMLQDQLPVAFLPREVRLHAALPYTSAGKIDRRALADADSAAHRPQAGSLPDTDLLRAIWSACLPGSADAGEDQSFWDLGGDSLAAIELLMRLEKEAGVHLPVGDFLADPTLRGLRKTSARRGAPDPSGSLPKGGRPPVNLITLQSSGERPPIYVIHGWGGKILKFRHFAQAMAPRRAVHGLEAPPPDGEGGAIRSVAGLASLYADQIIAHSPGGPIHLMGFSIGGWYAHAVAAALLERGATLGFVGILDTNAAGPLIDGRVRLLLLPHRLASRLAGARRKLAKLRRIPSEGADDARPPGPPKSQAELAILGTAGPEIDPFLLLLKDHRPARLPVTVDLFSTRGQIAHLLPLWRHYARSGVRLHPIFANHFDFLDAGQAASLAAAIESALGRTEAEVCRV